MEDTIGFTLQDLIKDGTYGKFIRNGLGRKGSFPCRLMQGRNYHQMCLETKMLSCGPIDRNVTLSGKVTKSLRPPLQLDFADLNDGLSVSVIGNIG